MEPLFNEEMIRAELRRLDVKTGFHAAELPIKFGKAKGILGKFSHTSDGKMEFYFSNYYFRDPEHPVEEKLDTIRHEYAHYMDYIITGSSSHGPSWKKCCKKVGAFPSRCFSSQRADLFKAKHEKERQLNEKFDKYSVGNTIIHPSFGSGTIIDITGEGICRIACISFDGNTIKRIAVSWIESNCRII